MFFLDSGLSQDQDQKRLFDQGDSQQPANGMVILRLDQETLSTRSVLVEWVVARGGPCLFYSHWGLGALGPFSMFGAHWLVAVVGFPSLKYLFLVVLLGCAVHLGCWLPF